MAKISEPFKYILTKAGYPQTKTGLIAFGLDYKFLHNYNFIGKIARIQDEKKKSIELLETNILVNMYERRRSQMILEEGK